MKILALIGIAAVALAGTACGDEMGHSSASIDQQFIDMMVPHHEGAVAMATIAKERAEHQEIGAMAEAVIKAQSAEISQLKGWRMMWFGSDVTPPMGQMPMMDGMSMSGMRDMMASIERLKTASPFDKAFIEEMVPHHEAAIAAARICHERGERAELRKLAEDVIRAQGEEIVKMQGWYSSWFPGTQVPGITR